MSFKASLSKLQHVQKSAAWLVKQVKWTDHITPHLLELQWLPVFHLVRFKLLLHALNGLTPVYICDLLSYYQPPADLFLLDVPATCLITCGDRAFSVAAPQVWNGLPQYLRKCTSLTLFKSQLKHSYSRMLFLLNIRVILQKYGDFGIAVPQGKSVDSTVFFWFSDTSLYVDHIYI